MITNKTNIPLSLAIWLLHDTYDHNPDPYTISVTSLLKPLRAIVLGRTVPSVKDNDLSDFVASKMGSAIHTAIEDAWVNSDLVSALVKLGYPEKKAEKIVINPTEETLDMVPVYMEQRSSKQVGAFQVTGKYDFIIDGCIEDFKSTSTWAWIFQSNVEKYIEQGSIYRWLNPDKVKSDYMQITYIFTDWSATKAKQDSSYPQERVKTQKLVLMSMAETERFVTSKIDQITALEHSPQTDLPQCTKEELWQSDSVWKYYKDPNKTARSTKNFDNYASAYTRKMDDGGVGSIIEVKGQAKHCIYCNAAPVCTQREHLELAGILKI